MDLSVSETLFNLVMIGNYKKAQTLRDEFKVPAARFYYLKIAALAKRGKWDTLQRFANERKPPVGYMVRGQRWWGVCAAGVGCGGTYGGRVRTLAFADTCGVCARVVVSRRCVCPTSMPREQPFADACVEANQFDDALQYIEKFSHDDDKIEYYIKIQCVSARCLATRTVVASPRARHSRLFAGVGVARHVHVARACGSRARTTVGGADVGTRQLTWRSRRETTTG